LFSALIHVRNTASWYQSIAILTHFLGKTITATFTDPNSYPFFHGEFDGSVPGGLQGVNCEIKWFRDESPEGRTWPCDAVSQGYFGLQFLPGTTGAVDLQDFKLKFIHGVEPGSGYSKDPIKVEAEVAFQLPSKPTSCLKSGWCSWSAGK
jgi:hypothetical protein